MKFRVHVYLPAVKSAAPLQFEELGTNLLLFSHHIHDISNSAYFERVRMRTSDRPFVADVRSLLICSPLSLWTDLSHSL